MHRFLIRLALIAVTLVAAGFIVLVTPQPLFAHHVSYGRYQVW